MRAEGDLYAGRLLKSCPRNIGWPSTATVYDERTPRSVDAGKVQIVRQVLLDAVKTPDCGKPDGMGEFQTAEQRKPERKARDRPQRRTLFKQKA